MCHLKAVLPFIDIYVCATVEYICYDDGCHLRKYARNDVRKDLTPTAQCLAKTEIVIDKMHFSGHTDKWCLDNCNPNNFRDLDNVRTPICFKYIHNYLCISIR